MKKSVKRFFFLKYLETKVEIQHTNLTGCSKSSFRRKVHSDKCRPQEMRKISNNLTIPKGSRRRRANEAQR